MEQLALHKGPIDHQLRGFFRKACSLPRLDLLPHRLEVPMHAVYPDRQNIHEAQVYAVLGNHGCERPRDIKYSLLPLTERLKFTLSSKGYPIKLLA